MFGMSIYCDFDTDEGGWMVIQRRFDGTLNFDRTWQEYRDGFGKVCSEFWLGLDNMYKLLQEKGGPFDLRIDMESMYGEKHFAHYKDFTIGSEADNYGLNIQFYNGTVADEFEYSNGQMFTTTDRDNDYSPPGNCAVRFHGGWWYKDCYRVNFNGVYIEGMQWHNMHLRKVSMKIREAV